MSNYCFNCGKTSTYVHAYPIDEALKETWNLTDSLRNAFNLREGLICSNCGVNARAQALARAIIESDEYGFGASSLKDWVKFANSNKIKLLELNSCHELHKTLLGLKGLTYSEYGTETEQDIENLTYDSGLFDIVLHSETLEHVSSPNKAMDECRRVIKDSGIVLFTTPVIWNRSTVKRAEIVNKQIVKLLPESYHGRRADDYLVFFEFGYNIDKYTGSKLLIEDWEKQNFVFKSVKISSKIDPISKARLFALQTISILRRI